VIKSLLEPQYPMSTLLTNSIRFEDCYWYTTMDVPGHGIVRGPWRIDDFDQYIGCVDVAGKTVLDVGCASGFLSFEAEKRGAIVTSFDAASMSQVFHLPFAENLYFEDREEWDRRSECGLQELKNSYCYAHQARRSNASLVYGDIFRLYRSIPAPVDIVLAGAIMEHLNDQVSAIASMARVAREFLVIAFTSMLETDELLVKPLLPMTDAAHDITWWIYSRGMYNRILENVGFELMEVKAGSAYCEYNSEMVTRSTIVARRKGRSG
jgi:SAM-dependent methyltransferase